MEKRNVDHDRFVRSNKYLALATEFDNAEKLGQINKKGEKKTCNNCNRRKHCKKSKIKIIKGAVSIGSEEKITVCDDWKELKSYMSEKQQKSLLKQFKKKW